MKRIACVVALASAIPACVSAPSPLAPGVRGSVGTPSGGVLTEATELPVSGDGFRRLRPRARTYFGTDALVRTLAWSAPRARVRESDPPLLVGDIAGPRGGRLSGHHSHRTGRDVDLLFFYVTPAGAPIEAPGFLKIGADGMAKTEDGAFVRLDVPRCWALVKALLSSPHAEVAWLFVASHVEALLVEHARALGEPDWLVWRAENVLHQPGDSAPHDDHFHLRIGCSDDEAVAGCVSGAPAWPWLPAARSLPPDASVEALLAADP